MPFWHSSGLQQIGNESVPKIIINNRINVFLNCSQHFIIANQNSFRVLLDKIVFVYFI